MKSSKQLDGWMLKWMRRRAAVLAAGPRPPRTLGWIMVLHTWKRDLGLHMHIHVLVTAGGLLLDGSTFQHVAGLYLFSGEAMGTQHSPHRG